MSEVGTYSPIGSLSGKSAIVTGAGRGIGAGVAEALLSAGAAVMLLDLDQATLETTADRLSAIGTTRKAICDVSRRPEVDDAVAQAAEAFGTIDIVVNNAQKTRAETPLIDTTEADLQITLDSGLWGTFHLMQACHPHLARRGGAIINFGSSAGLLGQAGLAAYAATKEAIRGLSRVAAREWGPSGITVNVICPAALSPAGKAWADANPESYQNILHERAIPRDGDTVTDIGATVVFLAGPGATFITGQTITVNGGYPLRP
ncbi:MAG TPA: SDR family NAD(P)-dependent oxidoreductase [Frankiaceae bacterium]|jgi:NAD(P)-dependent dehydrogenase (short-subunit alcohol dehydrogenase family)|nr:SDR family NAD(P)-dependent oxidoreductase [Frankiaceae bacterium]